MTEALRLNCDAVDCTPITIDWRDALDENGEGWTAYEAFTCDECNEVVVVSMLGEHEHSDLDDKSRCTGHLSAEGPMMNYWYPVKIEDCEEAAKLIANLPLCVVQFTDDKTGLALTGGGMDLSWEICEAFMALGYWPPLHFCDLPRMASRGTSDKDHQLIAACMETCSIAEGWAARKRERLAENFPVSPRELREAVIEREKARRTEKPKPKKKAKKK